MIHLHVHSEGSLLDGLSTIERTVRAASEKGFPALALTEHGSLSTSIAFQMACEKYNVNAILGMEGYIELDGRVGHLTLLAQDSQGWHNLVSLNNIAQRRAGRRPTFNVDELIRHSDGLLCLSGCMASPLQSMPEDEAVQLGAMFKGVFQGRFFSELMFTGQDNSAFVERSLLLRDRLGIPLVLTNDVHFPYLEDGDAHQTLLAIKSNSRFSYSSRELWLKRAGEIAPLAKGQIELSLFREAVNNTYQIATAICTPSLKGKPTLPSFYGMSNKEVLAYLAKLVVARAKELGLGREYAERVKYELSVIDKMGFASYFAILLDIINIAREHGARLGVGRGSGVGSLVLYLLQVTGIDPIEHDLSFERFLNKDRQDFPDVDVDMDACTRELVLQEVADRWGGVQIATYSRFTHKALVNDLTRSLQLPQPLAKNVAENGPDSIYFQQMAEQRSDFLRAYGAMYGQIRHVGKHAGGIILLGQNNNVPLLRSGEQLVAAWTEGQNRELERAGLIKYDILAVSALDALRDMETMTGIASPTVANDPAVFELFQKQDLVGIFQFSGSAGIIELTGNVKPNTLNDLATINALYRPGALGAGTAQKFVEWRNNPRKLHPDIDKVLLPTAGVICYQEQVMKIFQLATGGTMEQADNARKLFSKLKIGNPEWEGKINRLEEQFLESAGAKWGGELASHLWDELYTHSRYSFNKSHSVAYSMTAYQMAFFKVYHPVAFFVAMLNADGARAKEYLLDAAQRGISIKPPHVNVSGFKYEAGNNAIYMPFSAAKFVGANAAREIVEKRASAYTSLEDFNERVSKAIVNKRSKLILWQLGAMEGLEGSIDCFLPKKEKGTVLPMEPGSAQREYLGYLLPSKDLIAKMRRWPVAGEVIAIEKRNKGRGDYEVITLLPHAKAWRRGISGIEVGSYIGLRSNEKGMVSEYALL